MKENSNKNIQPEWIKEYEDLFLKELINLPPPRVVDHEIELTPRIQPYTKAALKEQLRLLIEQG